MLTKLLGKIKTKLDDASDLFKTQETEGDQAPCDGSIDNNSSDKGTVGMAEENAGLVKEFDNHMALQDARRVPEIAEVDVSLESFHKEPRIKVHETTRSSKAMLTQSVLTPHGNVSVQTDRLTVHEETSMNVVVREDNEVHPSSSSSSSSLLSLQTTHPDPTPSDPKTNRTPPKEKDKKKKKKNESSQRTSRVRTRQKVARVNTHAKSRSRQHSQPTPTPLGSEAHPPTAAPSHTISLPSPPATASQTVSGPPPTTSPPLVNGGPHHALLHPCTAGDLDSFYEMTQVAEGGHNTSRRR